jgi:hypothetical protein
MRWNLSLRTFYFATWWALVGLTLLLALVSQACAPPILGLAFLFCLPSLVPRWSKLSFRMVVTALGIFGAVCAAMGIFSFHSSQDIAGLVQYGLVGLLPILLWRKSRPNGNWMALLLVFLISLVSLILGEEAIEFLLFILFALAVVFNLNAAHLYQHVGAFESAQTQIPRSYLPSFCYSVAMGMLLAMGIFLLFPRSVRWVSPFGLRSRDKTTNYTGTIALDGSSVRESTDIALRIEAMDSAWLARRGPTLYLRGNSLDTFDGVHWINSKRPVNRFQNTRPLHYTEDVEPEVHFVKIYRESGAGEWVLYPGVLREVVGPPDFVSSLRYDENQNLARFGAQSERYWYEVGIAIPRQADLDLPLSRYRQLGDPQSRYLTLGDGIAEKPYFKKWTREVGVDPRHATLQQALFALNIEFHQRYKATYQHAMPVKNSFSYFLTRGREGHCEYFATAAALFLRHLGIPSRVVLGYRGGEWNGVAQVLEVREAAAHAWVELYVPGTGWVTYDPTPVEFRVPPAGLWEEAALYLSAARFWFERYIVQYNGNTQRGLANRLVELRVAAAHGSRFSWVWWERLLAGLAGVAAVGALALRARRRRRRSTRRFTVPEYYAIFVKRLKTLGYSRQSGETYAAFHSRLRSAKFDPELIARIDSVLERDLYSPRTAPSPERQSLKRRVRAR